MSNIFLVLFIVFLCLYASLQVINLNYFIMLHGYQHYTVAMKMSEEAHCTSVCDDITTRMLPTDYGKYDLKNNNYILLYSNSPQSKE